MTLILINEPNAAPLKDHIADPRASHGMLSLDLPVVVLSPDALPSLDTGDATNPNHSEAPPAALDPTVHALLFGRYVGQINARIERVWLRPRSPIGAGTFSCQVQIKQDHQGNVEETTLEHCNGDTRWQLSLVQAIQSASPLPSPPDRRVFADAVTLQFNSKAYIQGGTSEGFERDDFSGALRSDTLLLHNPAGDLNSPASTPRSHVLIQLHIVGNHDTTTSAASTPISVHTEPRARGPTGKEYP